MVWVTCKGKKGFEFLAAWVEVFFIVFILLGLLIGFSIRNVITSYAIIFLCGLVTGTIIYSNRRNTVLPNILLAAGFAVGYIIGNRVSNITILLALFVLGNFASYHAFDKKLIKLI